MEYLLRFSSSVEYMTVSGTQVSIVGQNAIAAAGIGQCSTRRTSQYLTGSGMNQDQATFECNYQVTQSDPYWIVSDSWHAVVRGGPSLSMGVLF